MLNPAFEVLRTPPYIAELVQSRPRPFGRDDFPFIDAVIAEHTQLAKKRWPYFPTGCCILASRTVMLSLIYHGYHSAMFVYDERQNQGRVALPYEDGAAFFDCNGQELDRYWPTHALGIVDLRAFAEHPTEPVWDEVRIKDHPCDFAAVLRQYRCPARQQ